MSLPGPSLVARSNSVLIFAKGDSDALARYHVLHRGTVKTKTARHGLWFRNSGNVEAFRNLSADYLVRLPEFTRSTTLRWTFLVASIFALVASIFAASQLTDYIETIGAPT
jgi:hypothetical protein